MEGYHFRFMTADDVPAVYELEKLCFPDPWSKESLMNEMVRNAFAKYIVMENGERLIGYGGMWIILNEAHITNIAVHPDFRGRKLGEALLREMMRLAKGYNASRMTLEVRRSNHIAQSLYRKLGFQEAGIRPRYYSDNQEDAIIMWAELQE